MAKHKSFKDAIREKEFRAMIEDALKKQYQRGLLVGSRSMLKVIGDKIAAEGQTPEERLTEAMKIINNMLTMTDLTEKQNQGSVEDGVTEIFSGLNREEDETAEDSKVVELPVKPEESE